MKLYCMYPTSSFEKMVTDLRHRERRRGTDIPITVGILIADYRRSFCKENIFDQLERLDRKSGPLIDFYIPGYTGVVRGVCDTEVQMVFKKKVYAFSQSEFDEFLDQLEMRDIKVTGRTQLLLVPYENGCLWFQDAVAFDLEKDESSGKIESTKLFFDFIFEISKRTTDFEEFKKKIKLRRSRVAVIEFVKEQLLSSLWSLLTSPFAK